jgi:threonine synthase
LELNSKHIELECPNCGRGYEVSLEASYCDCGSPLLVKYDTDELILQIQLEQFPSNQNSLWRYSRILPVVNSKFIFSLGEGWTPLLKSRRLGEDLGMKNLYIKDESRNPTLSFKDRGLCVAISKHLELGASSFALPSAGNAAISMSAYSAAAGVTANVFMPVTTPSSFIEACGLYGAEVVKVKGTISECGAEMKKSGGSWTDLSTTKEPYRVEGKKTLGYEICEQLNWQIPDVIICPTGGGTAIIGIWKAFNEMEALGLIETERPRLFASQVEGCAPVVKAVNENLEDIQPWDKPEETSAYGLRVPSPFAGKLILNAISSTNGGAVPVSENEIMPMRKIAARLDGLDICPEAAVAIAGLQKLVESDELDSSDTVIMLNTASGIRYPLNDTKR